PFRAFKMRSEVGLPIQHDNLLSSGDSAMRYSSFTHRLFLTLLLITSFTVAASAQSGQQMDADFAKSVKEWTTKPEFISPLVDHLPKVAGVPSPKDVLGYYIGQPKKLTYTADIYRYYRALEKASPRVKVINIGQTDEGRECLIVFVANE